MAGSPEIRRALRWSGRCIVVLALVAGISPFEAQGQAVTTWVEAPAVWKENAFQAGQPGLLSSPRPKLGGQILGRSSGWPSASSSVLELDLPSPPSGPLSVGFPDGESRGRYAPGSIRWPGIQVQHGAQLEPSSFRIWLGATLGGALGYGPVFWDWAIEDVDASASDAFIPAVGAFLGGALFGSIGDREGVSIGGLALGAFAAAVPVALAIQEYPHTDTVAGVGAMVVIPVSAAVVEYFMRRR